MTAVSDLGSGAARRQRGIALVLVLWVLALLTVIALGLTTAQRTESALTRNQLDAARFRALAEAAVAVVGLDLLTVPLESEPNEALWLPDGRPRPLELDGNTVQVRLYNEASRLDLNSATRDQLAALIEIAQGEAFDEVQRDQLADAIIDWRDADDLVQLNGAEDGDYASAGLPYGAADRPFRSVEELGQVLGMTRALYRRLAPDLTVAAQGAGNLGSGAAGGTQTVDLTFASPALIAALEGISLEDAQARLDPQFEPLSPEGQPNRLLGRGGPLYRVRVSTAGASAHRTMEALVRIESGGREPLQMLSRRFGLIAQPGPQVDPAAADR